MSACRVCASPLRATTLDLGPQPVTKKLLRSPKDEHSLYPLAVVQCATCGTVQLREPFPVPALIPLAAGGTREPEGHLDNLVEHLCALLPQSAHIIGISSKDDTTLARFERRGYGHT